MFCYNQQENVYNVVHVRTDLNLSADSFQCQLEYGKGEKDQQAFCLQEIKENIWRIRDHNDNFLCLDGILQPNDYAERDSSQEFMIKKVKIQDIPAFTGTGYIWTQHKRRALDLTNASRKKENQIILYEPNYRMNQRWVFQGIQPQKEDLYIRGSIDRSQHTNSIKIYIRSALTQQFVTFNRQKNTLMQSSYPQQWRLQRRNSIKIQNENFMSFYFKHIKLNKYLAYKQDKYLIYLDQEPCLWIIPEHQLALVNAFKNQGGVIGRHSI